MKLLIISGPTATGKTKLAVKLAKKYHGEIVSADSRQIYRGLEIGTGKDHPKNIPIHLIDIIDPDQSFSVAQYQKLATSIITDIHSRHKLPIVVGGTGQYIDAILAPKSTFTIPPNFFLRSILNLFPVSFLKIILKFIDRQTYNSLNNSDVHNPHRLIRKIEIKIYNLFHFNLIKNLKFKIKNYNTLHLSLTAPNSYLYPLIDARVTSRLKAGLFAEIKNLLKHYSWSAPGLNALAYKEFKTSFAETSISRWRFDEHSYARRQKTWFKKRSNITLFDITSTKYPQNLLRLVDKWYNQL